MFKTHAFKTDSPLRQKKKYRYTYGGAMQEYSATDPRTEFGSLNLNVQSEVANRSNHSAQNPLSPATPS